MSKIPEGATHKNAYGFFRKLQDGIWYSYADGDWIRFIDAKPETYIPIQADPEWTGKGTPPVGVEIEVKHKDATPEWARPDFYKAEIVAIGKQLVIFAAEATGCETVGKIEDYEFRPVRTLDQIAAMERSLACDRIYGIITGAGVERKGNTSDMAEALYDAGLRFVEVTK